MKYKKLILEKEDFLIIKRLLNFRKVYTNHKHREALEKLKLALNTALVYDHEKMPKDVVRLNALVTVISKDGKETRLQLVLPNEEHIPTNKISVRNPLGTEIIGKSEGDGFLMQTATGLKSMRIKTVENYISPKKERISLVQSNF